MRLLSLPLLVACSLLLLLCLPSAAAAAAPSPSRLVLSPSSFPAQIAKPGSVTLVSFCSSKQPRCRELAPHFQALVKPLAVGSVTVAEVNCDQHAQLCQEQGAGSESSMPLIKLYSAGTAKTPVYKSKELRTKDLVEWVWSVYPNHVQLLTSALEKRSRRPPAQARVLLFTDKRETSPLYKSIAMALHAQDGEQAVVVSEVRKQEKGLLRKYGIGSSFPVLLVEPPTQPGEEPRSARRYEGRMEKELILTFVRSFLPSSGAQAAAESESAPTSQQGEETAAEAASSASAPSSAAAASSIPQLLDQSCLDKHCGTGLCVVMLMSSTHPDLARQLGQLELMAAAVRKDKAAGKFTFVWADQADAAVAQWAQTNFDTQVQEYPQLLLLSLRKGRYAPFVGAFALPSVQEFLKDVSKGRTRTVPFVTRDGKISPLSSDTQHCPPEAPKKTEAPKASSSSAAVPEAEGELHVLTLDNHASLVQDSVRPWMILFHSSAASAASSLQSNISAEFERVARNMRNMVQFGTVDVAQEVGLGLMYGVNGAMGGMPDIPGMASTLDGEQQQRPQGGIPAIRALPAGKSAKSSPHDALSYPLDLASPGISARDIRSFAQRELLAQGQVYPVSQDSMQGFFGEVVPGEPFAPKLLLFAKPASAGSTDVPVPDWLRALSLEFGSVMTFGAASSTSRQLARQFNIVKIPGVVTLGQQPDQPGAPQEMQGQVSVGVTNYDGPLQYSALRTLCERIVRDYQAQKREWASRAAAKERSGKAKGGSKRKQPKVQEPEEEHVDLDRDEL